ncbi:MULTISPECIES: hypothetical protein [Leptolyngbya]|uniref:hypothetical protein n=1 Tax=Leptolyngbya TaxID=47251 RepID=UPI000367F503|nr:MULTISPECIES: hypothetical protein [Leptolyngbya]MBD2365730.1 hypothetical protein [Leptolyngbya sp. FACHB-161]MBD2371910.1 hypothetical protein [Leptolyngbya sp. FACHB-238]MBD2396335.1 hypothetical protein [Leptolyngbya sp. FACHB-239]MBD2402857.1 hypothetical protein [Leptolyngbya sp. FACHB-402]ULP31656.1 hypothetical protein MCP04_07855 [Leptolyngbya boryana IU 594]
MTSFIGWIALSVAVRYQIQFETAIANIKIAIVLGYERTFWIAIDFTIVLCRSFHKFDWTYCI